MVLEKTLESPLDRKEIQAVHPKGDQSWVFIGRTDAEAETPIKVLATSWEELTHWKRPWCREGLGAGGEGDDRGWDGWMASPTRWAWIWVNSGSWLMDREAWHAAIHGVAKSWTRLSDWTELNWVTLNLNGETLEWSYVSKSYKKITSFENVIPMFKKICILSILSKSWFESGFLLLIKLSFNIFGLICLCHGWGVWLCVRNSRDT